MREASGVARDTTWLTSYYAIRAIFSLVWVAAAFTLGASAQPLSVVLLVAYPAWDAVANGWDAARHGGWRANPTQAVNALVSAIVTIAVAIAAARDPGAILYVVGAWAVLAGLLQLATGVRRWQGFSAQWPMILSGLQSALAGVFMASRAVAGVMPPARAVAPYAAFGAIYFAIAAGVLVLSARRQERTVGAS